MGSTEKKYQSVIKQMNENRERRLKGESIAIPWSLPRLSKFVPGIEQRRYNIVSAPPKGGKTQITDYLFMYEPLDWLLKHPNSDIDLKIFYFSLEMSVQAKIRAAISHNLLRQYGTSISPQKLISVYEDYIYGGNVKKTVESEEFLKWLDFFDQKVEFHDNIRNPYGIFNTVQSFAERNGTYTYKYIDWRNDDGNYETKRVRDTYIPNNPNLFVIIIVDHISLLQTEKGQSLHQSIGNFSSQYCLQMRDMWGYIPVVVQQQSAASSSINQSFSKKQALELVKPDPEGLADNKYTARDCDLMLSLFNPVRYDISDYKGWNLDRMGDFHRELKINLNRNGISNAASQLYFNGASSYFSELPMSPSEDLYREIERLEKENI